MTVTNIPQKAVVRQDSKPTAPQAGLLWYDTQNNILKQYKNGSFQGVGSSPDGISISKNSNGELQAIGSELIGDFENGQDGWSAVSTPSDVSTSTSHAQSGNQTLEVLNNNGTDNFTEIKQAFTDLDKASEFLFYFYVESIAGTAAGIDIYWLDGNDNRLDSNEIYNANTDGTNTPYTFVGSLPIPDDSNLQKIKIDPTYADVYIDYLRLKKSQIVRGSNLS